MRKNGTVAEETEVVEEKKPATRSRSPKAQEKKHLTEEEQTTMSLMLERVKTNQEKLRVVELSERIHALEIENLKLQSQVLELRTKMKEQMDARLGDIKESLTSMKTQAEQAKDAYVNEIREKYEIVDTTFGFHPDTGEIVLMPAEGSSS